MYYILPKFFLQPLNQPRFYAVSCRENHIFHRLGGRFAVSDSDNLIHTKYSCSARMFVIEALPEVVHNARLGINGIESLDKFEYHIAHKTVADNNIRTIPRKDMRGLHIADKVVSTLPCRLSFINSLEKCFICSMLSTACNIKAPKIASPSSSIIASSSPICLSS